MHFFISYHFVIIHYSSLFVCLFPSPMTSNETDFASQVIDCLHQLPDTEPLSLRSLTMDMECAADLPTEVQSVSPPSTDLPPIYGQPVTEEVRNTREINVHFIVLHVVCLILNPISPIRTGFISNPVMIVFVFKIHVR